MLAENPDDEQLLQHLATTLGNLAFLYHQADADQAEKLCEQALEIHDQLARLEPERLDYQRELAMTYSNA